MFDISNDTVPESQHPVMDAIIFFVRFAEAHVTSENWQEIIRHKRILSTAFNDIPQRDWK